MTDRARRPLEIAIVGAGYAGLAAARRLARAGARVTVFERSSRPGGLAMTLPFAGTEIEKYYHHWFTSDEHVLALAAELGLESRIEWRSPVMGMFRDGRIWRFTAPSDLLRFEPLSFAGKLRFGLVTLFLQRWPKRETFEGVTASAWLRRMAGREVWETIWGPMLDAKFGRHAERVSMVWIWSKMRLRGNSRTSGGTKEALGYLEGGFGRLTTRIAEDVVAHGGTIRLAERVRRIERAPGGLGVTTSARSARFDHVVATVAPPLLADLAPDLPAEHRERCRSMEHTAVLCTLFQLRESISPIYWLNVGDADVPFNGVIEHTNFVPPEVYGGRRLAYLSHYLDPDDPEWSMSSDELLAHYLPGLRRIQPRLDREWILDWMPFRDRWTQPIVTADFHRRLLPLATPIEGLWLASMAQIYPEDRGTNYAVRIGHEVADALLAAAWGAR